MGFQNVSTFEIPMPNNKKDNKKNQNKKNNKPNNQNTNNNSQRDQHKTDKPTSNQVNKNSSNIISIGPFTFDKKLLNMIVDAQDKSVQPSLKKMIASAEKDNRLISNSESPNSYIFLANGFVLGSKNKTETLIKKIYDL